MVGTYELKKEERKKGKEVAGRQGEQEKKWEERKGRRERRRWIENVK